MDDNIKLAVLIDAENAQPSIVDGSIVEIANYGTVGIKQIYANWTGPNLKGLKDVLSQHSIQPVQQFLIQRKGKWGIQRLFMLETNERNSKKSANPIFHIRPNNRRLWKSRSAKP